jgi:protein FAM50
LASKTDLLSNIGEKKKKKKKKMKRTAVNASEERKQPLVSMPSFAQQSEVAPEKSGGEGLLTVEEFRRKRDAIAKLEKKEELKKVEKKKTRQKSEARARMSFRMDEDDDEDVEDEQEQQQQKKKSRLGKDPTVETGFLRDADREAEEEKTREALAEAWRAEQERVKRESLVVVFSFWDGKGTRRAMRLHKGATVGEFLKLLPQTVEEARGVPSDQLIFVKHDQLLPHHFSFYELLLARDAAGRPVFDFSEDAGGHTAKVCERRWYEQNKHIFPASKWVVYGR